LALLATFNNIRLRLVVAFYWLSIGREFQSSELADGVYVEHVSATEFPANREITKSDVCHLRVESTCHVQTSWGSTEIIDHSINDRGRKGCFLVNSALKVAPHQSKLRALIAEQFGEIEGFFERCIRAAQADGTAPSGVDANDTARLLLGVLLGIRVLARSTPKHSLLEAVLRPALALLDLPHHKSKTR
jgi:hypothetical protein